MPPRKHRTMSEALDRTFRNRAAAAAEFDPTTGDGATWQIKPVETTAIRVERRLRPVLDDAKVEALAESMSTIGLVSPIVVSLAKRDDTYTYTYTYTLVAGTHRLEAARRLEWQFIDARIVDGPLERMRLMEIDENLARADLTPLDRARFLAARKSVYERMHPERRHGGDRTSAARAAKKEQVATMSTCSPADEPNSGPRTGVVAVRSFSADAADLAGLSERTVRRGVEIGEGLAEDVAVALAETPLAHREGDLRAIARMPDDEQRALIRSMRSLDAPPRTLREVQMPDEEPADPDAPPPSSPGLDALKRAWNRADDADRQSFRDWIAQQTEGAPQ